MTLNQTYRMCEEELDDIKRASNKLKEYYSEWSQLDRTEKRLLEEVAYFSQGTIAQKNAVQAIDEHLYESRSAHQLLESLEDSYRQSEKNVRKKMDSIKDEIDTLRKEEQHAQD
ncbi:hypothetical protein [Listeria grayi]|uniref:hypothetical protein n=1 Tax=Listeria grayi TaxID=1641 RepID=UPI001624D711|nr:hypothetical protein [Listeria grayi]MBC1921990.1 hypothetical protein [Listeria grayi]